MSNELIESCKYIGDFNGLKFLFNAIFNGVKSRSSLMKLYTHCPYKASLDVDASLILLRNLGVIDYDGSKILLNHFENVDFSNQQFVFDWFSQIFCNYLIDNFILSIDSIKYDNVSDCFYLPFNAFLRKHAVYRNLLITLSVLSVRQDGNYAINSILIANVEHRSKNRKLSQAGLLKILESQQRQGDLGEEYVFSYELNRLSNHPLKNNIKRISIIDVSAGFDIVSFEDETSYQLNRFIEVKTYKDKPHFHWSANEIDIAKLQGDRYYLYLVDANQINNPNYEPIIIRNPIEYFSANNSWISKIDSYFFEYFGDVSIRLDTTTTL